MVKSNKGWVKMNRFVNYCVYGTACLMLALCCCACQMNLMERFNDWAGLEDDNLLEESVEFAIDHEIGLDVDLSPRSPE